MATRAQIAANRRNGPKGGVKTPEGKAISCGNARTHGIFAAALTPFDAEALGAIHDELTSWLKPVGPLENMLVEKLALTYVRLQRCARAEAELHSEAWWPKGEAYHIWKRCHPEQRGTDFHEECFEKMVNLIGRYDTALTNQFIKLMHELERLQRMRSGEKVAAPLAADVTVQVEATSPGEETLLGDDPRGGTGIPSPGSALSNAEGVGTGPPVDSDGMADSGGTGVPSAGLGTGPPVDRENGEGHDGPANQASPPAADAAGADQPPCTGPQSASTVPTGAPPISAAEDRGERTKIELRNEPNVSELTA